MPLRYKSLHITFLIPFHPPTKRQRGKNSATSPSQPLLPPPLCQRSSPAVPPRPPREHSSLLPSPPAPRLSSRCAATRSCGRLRARAANQAGLGLMYSPWPSAGLILPCAGASALHTTQPCSRLCWQSEGGTSRGMQQPAGEGGSGSPDRDANECQLKTVII